MAQHSAPSVRDPELNARITNLSAVVLLVLLFVEGTTLVSLPGSLTLHVVLGTVLLGPVAVKTLSTGWRMIQYYRGDPAYVAKGPPPLLLRLLGPVLSILTWLLLVSGIALMIPAWRSTESFLFFVHKASFVLWFAAMTVHVLGHLKEVLHYVLRRSRSVVARPYAWAVALSLAVASGLAALVTTWGSWSAGLGN